MQYIGFIVCVFMSFGMIAFGFISSVALATFQGCFDIVNYCMFALGVIGCVALYFTFEAAPFQIVLGG